jgi:hypothetical protein
MLGGAQCASNANAFEHQHVIGFGEYPRFPFRSLIENLIEIRP